MDDQHSTQDMTSEDRLIRMSDDEIDELNDEELMSMLGDKGISYALESLLHAYNDMWMELYNDNCKYHSGILGAWKKPHDVFVYRLRVARALATRKNDEILNAVRLLIDLADNDCIDTSKLPHAFRLGVLMGITKARDAVKGATAIRMAS